MTDWRQQLEINAQGEIQGRVFPEARWRPRVLAQPAMVGHTHDEFSSGVWHPGDGELFLEDQFGSELVTVGQGYPLDTLNIGATNSGGATVLESEGGYLRELAGKIASGAVDPTKIYTASIHIRDEKDLFGVGATLEGLRSFLAAIKDLIDGGQIVFKDYESVAALWEAQYSAAPNRLDIGEFSIGADIQRQTQETCTAKLGAGAGNTPGPGAPGTGGGSSGESSCPEGQVFAAEASRCVPDCRLSNDACPQARPTCDQTSGLCLP